ncbi:hypothetical protein LguiB_022495 [Lonicera macranthoides]
MKYCCNDSSKSSFHVVDCPHVVAAENLMFRSVDTRITPFLGLTGEKVNGRPLLTSCRSWTTSSGQVSLPVLASVSPPPLPRNTGSTW